MNERFESQSQPIKLSGPSINELLKGKISSDIAKSLQNCTLIMSGNGYDPECRNLTPPYTTRADIIIRSNGVSVKAKDLKRSDEHCRGRQIA